MSYIKSQKIKHSLKSLAYNLLDFDDKCLRDDHKRIVILKRLNQKFAILKPDKGSGVVVLNKADYRDCIQDLFSDSSKFQQIQKDPTLTQLKTVQSYLLTLKNRAEISEEVYQEVHPTAAHPGRARGLPKTHKTFQTLPKFRPIVDTIGTVYSSLGKYLTQLLQPLTCNEFRLKDSFDAANRINQIPKRLFEEGYRFISFDVESLFTNVPLKRTINIVLDRIYRQHCLNVTLKERTLKKLLLDSCTKTAFLANGKIYQQVDGVTMGTSLGPLLADVIMTEVEKQVLAPLISDGTIPFYVRFVDDTLLLLKPSDISKINKSLNSFDNQLKFTSEEFTDNNDVHFLDLKITTEGTAIFRKATHTGQFVHFSSFQPWKQKMF